MKIFSLILLLPILAFGANNAESRIMPTTGEQTVLTETVKMIVIEEPQEKNIDQNQEKKELKKIENTKTQIKFKN
jgi:hypothetical protein